MTFELTNERLQDIAIKAVSQFMNKEASLSEALAKEAMDLELNSDQIKRTIEATNTIAYLRQLEKSADRTFEFPVADFNHVMGHMCLPEGLDKAAGTPPWLDKDKDGKTDSKEDDKGEAKDKKDKDDHKEETHKGEDFGKSDKKEDKKDKGSDEKEEDEDDEKSESDSDEDKQEKRAMLNKAFFQAKDELGRMVYDESIIYMDLVKSASVVRNDPQGLEKLAFVVSKSEVDKVTKLCGIEKRAAQDLVFTTAELKEADQVYRLMKQAEAFVGRKAQLEDFVKRAEKVLFHKTANVEKLASIAGGVGGIIGGAIGAVGGGVLRAAKYVAGRPFKGVSAFSQAGKAKGFKDTASARAHYDNIKLNQGRTAAKKAFGGAAPSLAGRVGMTGVGTALTGMTVDHAYTVKNDIK